MALLTKILHIEDEEDIREVAKMALEDIGNYTIESCSSGVEGIEKAARFMPNLILLDVMMPEMDGPTTLLKLRQLPETAQTPVIFMTAKVQANEIDKYKALGALDVIVKPFDPITLSDQIREIWDRNK